MWYPKQFTGQVSPHQFLQIVAKESNKVFSIDKQCDHLDFLEWIMMSVHRTLIKSNKTKNTMISETFFGELEIWAELNKGRFENEPIQNRYGHVKRKPFLYLGMDLPRIPLFKNAFNR